MGTDGDWGSDERGAECDCVECGGGGTVGQSGLSDDAGQDDGPGGQRIDGYGPVCAAGVWEFWGAGTGTGGDWDLWGDDVLSGTAESRDGDSNCAGGGDTRGDEAGGGRRDVG